MDIYDTLIIGSGYFSAGYAMARGNCIICEENQICDTQFYLPLRTFKHKAYEPKTDEGKRLFEIFSELELFADGMQNTNGFECGFCKFLFENPLSIMLKCRIVELKAENGLYRATVQTNEGISHLYAKSVLSTKAVSTVNYHTTLFVGADDGDLEKLTNAFPDSYVEKAFYNGRYALYTKVDGFDENEIKHHIYNKWSSLGTKAKILYMAPTFVECGDGSVLCDGNYKNPIEAFEGGYFYAKEGKK